MCTYYNTKANVTHSRIDDFFFLTLTVRRPCHRKDFKWEKLGGMGLISEIAEVLYAEFNGRAEAVSSSYSVTGASL